MALFHRLVQSQLTADMDRNCEPLGKQGTRGALFKITLASFGYTFVGKGTVQAFVPDLLHEGKMYGLLTHAQGSTVPVYLGNMDLERTYYLDVGVRIVHMLYMAWGGEHADDHTPPIPPATLEYEQRRSLAELADSGVFHQDARPANMLWNTEKNRVMMIDFERSTASGKRKTKLRALNESSHDVKRRRLRRHKAQGSGVFTRQPMEDKLSPVSILAFV
jgi:hypothetical protein